MKRILIALLLVCLLAGASAERVVVTPVASEINPDAPVSAVLDARITDYDKEENTLTVEIIIPEYYDPKEIESLKVGDAIFTQGKEFEISSISEEYGYLVLNRGEYIFSDDSLWLLQALNSYYQIMEYDDHTWTLLTTLKVPVAEHLLFLDGIDPSSGESLSSPAVHNGQEFLSMLEAEKAGGPGFAANNILVVFDEHGELALVQRFYVPWQ